MTARTRAPRVFLSESEFRRALPAAEPCSRHYCEHGAPPQLGLWATAGRRELEFVEQTFEPPTPLFPVVTRTTVVMPEDLDRP